MEDKKFIAPLPLTETKLDNPILTITASLNGDRITITETRVSNRQSFTSTVNIKAIDQDTFQIPDSLPQPTANMLIGIGQRMLYLKNATENTGF